MKVADYFWENPSLLRYLHEVNAGDYLFRQNEPATTMFIVVRGVVELRVEDNGESTLHSIVEAGHFLGEKAILGDAPYPRAFAAKAKTRVLVFELGLKDVDDLKATVPELLTDILKQMFLTAAHRLDRSNGIITALRPASGVERLLRLFLFFASRSGSYGPRGTEVFLQKSTIHFYVEMDYQKIDSIISELVGAGLLMDDGGENYTIPDQQKLLDAVPTIVKRVEEGRFDEMDLAP